MTDQHKSRPLPAPACIRAEVVTAAISAEARTVPIVFTTGAVVRRWRWADDGWEIEEYDERLSLAPGAMRTSFLDSGRAPFLDAHDSRSNDSVLGVIEAGSVKLDAKAGRGEALVRFDDHDLAERRFKSVRAGILRNVSVGYNVHAFTETRAADVKKGIVRELTASDWEPLEVSQVPIGADRDAETLLAARSFASQVTSTIQRGQIMDNQDQSGGVVDLEAVKREAVKGELVRQDAIKVAARALRLGEDDAVVTAALRSIDSASDARDKLIRRAAELDDARAVTSARSVDLGTEDSEKKASAIARGLMARAHPGSVKIDSPEVAHYAQRSLLQIAEEALERRGVNTRGMSRSQIAELALRRSEVSHVRAGGMLSTSDFPLVLADVANKSLRMGYDMAPRTFTQWARRVTAVDFKSVKRVQLSGGLALAQVPEGGEFTRGKTHEGRESYSINTFGKIVAITRQTLINDDLDAFSRIPMIYGGAAADLESDTVYGILGNNAALADGVALFHATHANLGTAGVPSTTTLGEARKMLRRQTDLDGSRLLNLMARFVVFPAALESVIDQLLTATTPATASNVTPDFIRSLIPISEPRLDDFSATVFYTMADPNRIDTIEYAYLAGEEGVQIETRSGWEVDGVEIKARLDFGAAAIDHRGIVKHPG